MKTSSIQSKVLYAAACAVLTFSCTSPRYLPSLSNNLVSESKEQKISYDDLTQMLRSIPDIKVDGFRETAQITVRRNVRFNNTEPPLFIVDGHRMGDDYTWVYRTVNVREVKRIGILNDSDALSTYGPSGKNGVVEIHTRLKR